MLIFLIVSTDNLERRIALHAELNRQIRLVELDGQHKSNYEKLEAWNSEKEAYLRKKETIESVSAAQLHLRLLDGFDKESEALYQTSVAQLKQKGAELASEKYERIQGVVQRETNVDKWFTVLGELSKKKRPVLEDDLAREQFKTKIRLLNQQHLDKYEQLNGWITEKEQYLRHKEDISSVSEARTQLSLLDTFEKNKKSKRIFLVSMLFSLIPYGIDSRSLVLSFTL